jgi:hypothetical protein
MTERSFAPIKTTVNSVLGQHLQVPKYQRPYTWKPDNIDSLWEDLVLANVESIFLGIIVLHHNDSRDEHGTERYEIIDGQQRLITITLLLCLIRNLMKFFGDITGAGIVQLAVEKSDALGSKGYIVKASNSLDGFFKTTFQNDESSHEAILGLNLNSLTDEQAKIVRNYRKFNNLFEDNEKWSQDKEACVFFLNEVKTRILSSELIQVTVSSEDDAYDLFETLNARSVSLSEVNMIKNRLFMELSKVQDVSSLERRWDTLEINAGGDIKKPEDIQKFINYFWWSRYSKISPKQIFRELRNEDGEYILRELEHDSELYQKLRSQDSSQLLQYRHIDITELKNLTQLLNFQQVNIPLLSIIRKLESEKYWSEYNNKNTERIIRQIEKFIFAYKYSERSPAKMEKVYSSNAIRIYKSNDRSELVQALIDFEKDLEKNMPLKEEFISKFKQLVYIPGSSQNNKIISYVLAKIYYGDKPEVKIDAADIEHIFPQNPIGGFSKDENEVQRSIHMLGNLTPLSEIINRVDCRNKRPNNKVIYLNKSEIKNNHILAEDIKQHGWGEETIKTRTGKLAEEMWDYLNK